MRDVTSLALVILSMSLPLQNLALAGEQTGIPPETVANYLHAVIEADRTLDTIHVVERMKKAEAWRQLKTGGQRRIPSPCRLSSSWNPAHSQR